MMVAMDRMAATDSPGQPEWQLPGGEHDRAEPEDHEDQRHAHQLRDHRGRDGVGDGIAHEDAGEADREDGGNDRGRDVQVQVVPEFPGTSVSATAGSAVISATVYQAIAAMLRGTGIDCRNS